MLLPAHVPKNSGMDGDRDAGDCEKRKTICQFDLHTQLSEVRGGSGRGVPSVTVAGADTTILSK